MDANKLTADILADELENWYPTINLCVHSANMLRQLQAENEALKRPNNVVDVPQDKLVDMQATIRQLQAENEAFKGEVAQLKHMNKNWQISENILLLELEKLQHRELTDEEIIESLAELKHRQWMKWVDAIMQTEKVSDVRFARWASCMIPYAELSEEMKEHDRVWARKALAILRKASE